MEDANYFVLLRPPVGGRASGKGLWLGLGMGGDRPMVWKIKLGLGGVCANKNRRGGGAHGWSEQIRLSGNKNVGGLKHCVKLKFLLLFQFHVQGHTNRERRGIFFCAAYLDHPPFPSPMGNGAHSNLECDRS